MVNELIILLSDQQQAELIKKAQAVGEDDDLRYLQLHISDWLSGSDEKRWEHKEK